MTKQDFQAWNNLSHVQQVKRFKAARLSLELTQVELAARLVDYGYKGGSGTVSSWEAGRNNIPVLVYELVREGFAERRKR